MWSDSFRAEERAALAPGALEALLSWVAVVFGIAALVAEVVVSIQVTSRDLATRNGSWALGLFAIALGGLGPYGTAAAWRSRRIVGKPMVRRLTATAVVAVTLGSLALAWLLLIRTTQTSKPLLPF